MNSRLTTFLLVTLTASLAAQTPQAKLKTRLAKKLASPFLLNAEWHTDFDRARRAAKREKKVLFGYFTRSFAP